jgi:hypothetical protein
MQANDQLDPFLMELVGKMKLPEAISKQVVAQGKKEAISMAKKVFEESVRAAADAKLAVIAVPNPLTANLQFPGATVNKDLLAGVGLAELRLILDSLK